MTFEEKFRELKSAYGTPNTKKIGSSFAVQVTIDDPECSGIFYIAYIGGIFGFEPYDYRDNTVAVTASPETLKKLFEGKIDVDSAVKSGELSLTGNADDAKRAFAVLKPKEKRSIIKRAVKKPETKAAKAEPKKAEPKKTEPKKAAEVKTTASSGVKAGKAANKTASKESAKSSAKTGKK